jgi:hypothetical protein
MIGASALFAAAALARRDWPLRNYGRVALLTILFGIAYTVFSEWLNVSVRGSWAYAADMPVVPWLGTGLSPILQWIVVPAASFMWVRTQKTLALPWGIAAARVETSRQLRYPQKTASMSKVVPVRHSRLLRAAGLAIALPHRSRGSRFCDGALDLR